MTLECPITIYTAAQVATMLQVSTRTVERLVTQGRLPAVRMGRRWRITHAQLQAYLREESTTPPDVPPDPLPPVSGVSSS
jgi:excisionase family DNA binding protein